MKETIGSINAATASAKGAQQNFQSSVAAAKRVVVRGKRGRNLLDDGTTEPSLNQNPLGHYIYMYDKCFHLALPST
jgi:hypothetical protein